MIKGTIIKGIGGFYYVSTASGDYECRARGRFRNDGKSPLVGDVVTIKIVDEKSRTGYLEEIHPRKSEMIRPKVANVDQVIIVFAFKEPMLNLDLLDRFIVLAEERGIDIIISLNKYDFAGDGSADVKEIYSNCGYPIVYTSATDDIGISELTGFLQGRISAFAGPSGVGKSSIINLLHDNLELKMTTGMVSQKIKRGKHTTRHSELIRIDSDSFIVDTPGFTSLSMEHIPKESLADYFTEFAEYRDCCQFIGCSHIHEPGCKVREQVDETIHPLRYHRYETFYQELKEVRKRYDI